MQTLLGVKSLHMMGGAATALQWAINSVKKGGAYRRRLWSDRHSFRHRQQRSYPVRANQVSVKTAAAID